MYAIIAAGVMGAVLVSVLVLSKVNKAKIESETDAEF